MKHWSTFVGCVLLLLTQIDVSSGSATVNVKVLSFTNPSNRSYDFTCCSEPCSTPCQNVFEMCINDPEPTELSCTNDNETYYSDTTLPDVQYKVDTWTGELDVKLFVYNLNSDVGSYDALDFIIIKYDNSTQSNVITQSGGRNYFKTSFTISITYECDADYYGDQCDTFCVPLDDATGHYECDNSTGEKTCLTGWSGADCKMPTKTCKGSAPTDPSLPIGTCQAIDMLFVLDVSKSVKDIDPSNWQNLQDFVKAIVDRVTLGPASFQIGVILAGKKAQYSIKLSESYDPDTLKAMIDDLEYEGEKTNMRGGLKLARSEGFDPANGGRPGAYQSVVIGYDGGPLSPEYGTWANEAPRLREMGADVFVVSLDYYFKRGRSQRTFVEAMASQPWVTHLWTDLADWKKLSTTVAPTILASVQDACLRKGKGSSGSSTTVGSTQSGATTNFFTDSPSTSTPLPSASISAPGSSAAGSTTHPGSTTTSSSSIPMPAALCSYRGYCSEEAETAGCYCNEGYAGPYCQYQVDPCSKNPCNWGECTKAVGGSYTCQCMPGFTGEKCDKIETSVSCDADPCAGGASDPGCEDTTANPQCSALPEPPCAQFFYGAECQTFCSPRDSCKNGHYTCSPEGEKVCRPGWMNEATGCTESENVTSTCGDVTCQNGGVCFREGCCCPEGFAGLDCTISSTGATTPFGSTTSAGTGSMATETSGAVTTNTGTTVAMTTNTGSTVAMTTNTGSTVAMTTNTGTTVAQTTNTGSTVTQTINTGSTVAMTTNTGTTVAMTTNTGTTVAQTTNTGSTVTQTTNTGSTVTQTTNTGSTVTQTTNTGTTGSMTTGGETTANPIDELMKFLQDLFKQNFPYLSPIQKQQLLNLLIERYLGSGNPSFADFTLNAPPMFVSEPFPGTGQLAGYSIRLEVFRATITRVDGAFQLSMTYDYIVTDAQGKVTRISPETFAVQSQDGDVVDTSLLNPANRQELKLYGVHLDQSQSIQIAEALKQAYGQVNAGWVAKMNSRIAIGRSDECLGLKGEKMTTVQFWLISGSASPYTEETSVIKPQDSDLENLLSQRLIAPPGAAILSHVTAYKLSDCLRVFLLGDVYDQDLPMFSRVLETYWRQKLSANVRATVLTQEPYLHSDGSRISNVIYIVQNGSTQLTPTDVKEPTVEDLQNVKFTRFNGNSYQIASSNLSSSALPVKNLFSILIQERADSSVFSLIEQRLQDALREFSDYEGSVAKVVATTEFFSVEKRVTYSKILFSVHNNGKLLDSRSDGTEFRNMWYLSQLLSNITLTNGNTLTYIIEDMSRDNELSRDSCFHVDVSGSLQDWRGMEKDLQDTLNLMDKSWTENRVTLRIAYLEQYINATGASVTRVFYSILETTADKYQFWIDSRQYDDLMPASSISDRIMISHGAGSGPKILVASDTTLERYVDSFGAFYSKSSVTTLSNTELLSLQGISRVVGYVGRYTEHSEITSRIARVEEVFLSTGESIWRVGYFIYIRGRIVRPESVELSQVVYEQDVVRDLGFIRIPDTRPLSRASDLFSLTIYPRPGSADVSSLQDVISSAMRSTHDDYELATIATKIIAVKELLILSHERSSVYQVYYKIQANGWPVSAYSESPPAENILNAQLAALKTSTGEAYYLWSRDLPTYRADMAHQLHAYGHVDSDTASKMVDTSIFCWLVINQGTTAAETKLKGLKPAFGIHGNPVTIVYYSVTVDSQPVYPDASFQPGQQCLSDSLKSFPYYTNTQVLDLDTLHRVTFKSRLLSVDIRPIGEDLEVAWSKQIGEPVQVTLVGAKFHVASIQSLEPMTSIYYVVEILSNVGMGPIMPYNQSLNVGLITTTPAVTQVKPDTSILSLSSLTLYGSQVSGSDVDGIASVLKSALETSTGVKNVTLKVLTGSQRLYTTDKWNLATRIDYVGVASDASGSIYNSGLYETIDMSGVSVSLQNKLRLSVATEAVHKNFHIFTFNNSKTLGSSYETLSAILTRLWEQANPGLNTAEISVSVHHESMRRKRDNRQSLNVTYETLDRILVHNIDYYVTIKGYDPDLYLVQEPTDLSISGALSSIGLVPACQDWCSDHLRQCSVLYILGPVTSPDNRDIERVIAAAYADVNAPNLNTQTVFATIVDHDLVQDNQGRDTSRLSYCIQLDRGSYVKISDVIVPSYDVMGQQMTTVGRRLVAADNVNVVAKQSKKGLQTSSIIIICVVCGIFALLVAAVAIWQLIRYCQRRERAEQDKQKLSIYDSDSFVGHATYNSSSLSSGPAGKRYSPGSVLGQIQFVEEAQP